jgi:hypothetical protein
MFDPTAVTKSEPKDLEMQDTKINATTVDEPNVNNSASIEEI